MKLIPMKNHPYSYDRMVIHLVRQLNPLLSRGSIHQLRQWLKISESSMYNKLSGRSRFSFEELATICRQAEISMDQLIHLDNARRSLVHFHMDGLMYPPRSYAEYLKNITNHFYKVKGKSNVHGLIISHEIPVFHLLPFPHLLYLKMYIWNRINWKIKDLPAGYNPYSFISDPDAKLTISVLQDLFLSFSHTEIWHPSILDNIITQYRYIKDMGLIESEEIQNNIIQDLHGLVAYLEVITDSGQKPANLKGRQSAVQILLSGMSMGPETILVHSDDLQMLFLQTEMPNYIKTTDQLAIEKFYAFFQNVRQHSTQITQSGGKEKYLFFGSLKEKVMELK